MPSDQLQSFGGDWTEQKLAILSAYLKAYNTALKDRPFTRVYVDAFAGTGYRQFARKHAGWGDVFGDFADSETQSFLKGSANLALDVCPPFHEYVFVESDPAKAAELELLRKSHPCKAEHIEIVADDANAYVRQFCMGMPNNMRAVVFLDPFATQVEWATIDAIAKTKAIDVWILFPLMAVNRLLANDHQKACRPALHRIFGTDEWFGQFYRAHCEDDIFGQPYEAVRKACSFKGIGDFYLQRLSGVFAKVAPKPRMLRNSRGTPLFLLFFAASNERGAPIAVRIAEHLLEKI